MQLHVISKRLKDQRIKQGLTQKQAAEMSGISVSYISKFERGIYPTRLVWFAAICDELGLALIVVPKDERWIGNGNDH